MWTRVLAAGWMGSTTTNEQGRTEIYSSFDMAWIHRAGEDIKIRPFFIGMLSDVHSGGWL